MFSRPPSQNPQSQVGRRGSPWSPPKRASSRAWRGLGGPDSRSEGTLEWPPPRRPLGVPGTRPVRSARQCPRSRGCFHTAGGETEARSIPETEQTPVGVCTHVPWGPHLRRPPPHSLAVPAWEPQTLSEAVETGPRPPAPGPRGRSSYTVSPTPGPVMLGSQSPIHRPGRGAHRPRQRSVTPACPGWEVGLPGRLPDAVTLPFR